MHHVFQVEGLLEEFTSELGITTDQFTQACSQLLASKAGQSGQDSEVIQHLLFLSSIATCMCISSIEGLRSRVV